MEGPCGKGDEKFRTEACVANCLRMEPGLYLDLRTFSEVAGLYFEAIHFGRNRTLNAGNRWWHTGREGSSVPTQTTPAAGNAAVARCIPRPPGVGLWRRPQCRRRGYTACRRPLQSEFRRHRLISTTCKRCTGARTADQAAHRHHQSDSAFLLEREARQGTRYLATNCQASSPSGATRCRPRMIRIIDG
jgi:hypothetical protein